MRAPHCSDSRGYGNRTHISHPDGNYFQTWYDGGNRPNFNAINGATGYLHLDFFRHGGVAWIGRGNGNATNLTYDSLQRVAAGPRPSPGNLKRKWTPPDFRAAGKRETGFQLSLE